MPIHNLVLETNSLVVGNNQLLTQANAVWVGNNLIVNNTIRWTDEKNVSTPGSDPALSTGLRMLLYPNAYAIGIEGGTVWYASGGNHRWYTSGTALGTFSTGGLNITTGANAVNFSNTTSNWIGWNQSGVAAPAVSTRSAGTKLLLYPNISATAVDYAIGIESGSMWFSVDNLNTTGFKWYANTTVLFQANSTGITQAVGNLNIDSGTLFVDAGPNRVSIGSTANNESTLNVLNNNVLGNIATASLVDPATNLITTGVHGWANGQPVFIRASTTMPAGVINDYTYYLCVRSTTTFTLHTTLAASLAGTSNVDITSAGSGTITAHPVSALASFTNPNSNANYIKILNYRNASGADWTTTSTRISQLTDITHQGYIEFNPPGFTSGIALGSYFTSASAPRNFLTVSSAGQILFSNTTANTAMIAANGNLGIGTTSPSSKLHVVGGYYLQNGDMTLTQGNGITWNNGDNYIRGISGYHLQFTTYDGVSLQQEVMRITGGSTASGGARVGIGTTSPAYKLHVEGTTEWLIAQRYASDTTTNRGTIFLAQRARGSLASPTVPTAGTLLGGMAGGGWNTSTYTQGWNGGGEILFLATQTWTGAANGTEILFYNTADGTTTQSERMKIAANGNVGIGTGSPSFKFEVQQQSSSATPSLRQTPQIVLKGYGGSSSYHSGIGFSMYEHTNGYWGSGILEVDDSGSYGAALAFYTSTGSATPTPSERMRIDSVGRTMFNTTTANTTANTIMTVKAFTSNTSSFAFEFRDSNDVLRSSFTDRGAQNWYIQAGDGLEKGSIRYSTPGGFVGILFFDSASTTRSDFRHLSGGGFSWHAHALGTVPPELMRLDASGNFAVGTATTSGKITANGNIVATGFSQGYLALTGDLSGYGAATYPTLKTDGSCIYFDALGTYTGYICYNGGFTDVSDVRLKTNITPLTNGLDIIMGLQGVNYAWADGRDDFKQHVGFIAQAVRDVLPEAVTDPHPHDAEEGTTPPALGVRTPPIVAALVEAIKEQQAIINSLTSRVQALENA